MSTFLAMLGVFAVSAGSYRIGELATSGDPSVLSLLTTFSGGLLVAWALQAARAGR